jgi:lipopolysaccharide heptosyltransferase I
VPVLAPVVEPVVEPSQVQRLLLVKLSSLGDVVHTLPLLEALRAGLNPNIHIGWAVRKKFADLLIGNPHLSQLYTLVGSSPADVLGFGRSLCQEEFDTVCDVQGLLVSGVVTRLAGRKRRIGFDLNREGNALFMTHPVVPGRERRHMVERLMGFCDVLGVPRVPPRPQTYLIEGERQAAAELLATVQGSPIVGCFVGASTPEKTWHAERWVELAQRLAKDGMAVVLLGGSGETAIAEAIQKASEGAIPLSLAGKTSPRVLASVLAQCDVVVGGDSGPTHLAVAVGTPVVGLYGVTDPMRTGVQWGASPARILDFVEAEAPPETRRPRHPTVSDALGRISASAVVEAVLHLFAERTAKGGDSI